MLRRGIENGCDERGGFIVVLRAPADVEGEALEAFVVRFFGERRSFSGRVDAAAAADPETK